MRFGTIKKKQLMRVAFFIVNYYSVPMIFISALSILGSGP